MESCKNLSTGLICKAIGALWYFEDRNNIGDFFTSVGTFIWKRECIESKLSVRRHL